MLYFHKSQFFDILSDYLTGKFAGSILESGSAAEFWSINNKANSTAQVAIKLNCITRQDWAAGNFRKAVECLKGKSVDDLVQAAFVSEVCLCVCVCVCVCV